LCDVFCCIASYYLQLTEIKFMRGVVVEHRILRDSRSHPSPGILVSPIPVSSMGLMKTNSRSQTRVRDRTVKIPVPFPLSRLEVYYSRSQSHFWECQFIIPGIGPSTQTDRIIFHIQLMINLFLFRLVLKPFQTKIKIYKDECWPQSHIKTWSRLLPVIRSKII
jgi:hypothetical protein